MAGLALKGVMKLFENENELSDRLVHPLVKAIPPRDERHQSQRHHSSRSHRASSRDDGHHHHRRHHSQHRSRGHPPPDDARRRSYHDHEPPPPHRDGHNSHRARSRDRDYTRAVSPPHRDDYSSHRARSQDRDYTKAVSPPPRMQPPPPDSQYRPPEAMKPSVIDHNYLPYDGMYGFGGPRARDDADRRFAKPQSPRRHDPRDGPRFAGPLPPSPQGPPMAARGGMQVGQGGSLLDEPRTDQQMVPPGW